MPSSLNFCAKCDQPWSCSNAMACASSGEDLTISERPSTGLDLASPAAALHLAAAAFAAELCARAQPGRRPFFVISIQARPYLQDAPVIRYSVSDLYGTNRSNHHPTPEAALIEYLAYSPDEGEQETAS